MASKDHLYTRKMISRAAASVLRVGKMQKGNLLSPCTEDMESCEQLKRV